MRRQYVPRESPQKARKSVKRTIEVGQCFWGTSNPEWYSNTTNDIHQQLNYNDLNTVRRHFACLTFCGERMRHSLHSHRF